MTKQTTTLAATVSQSNIVASNRTTDPIVISGIHWFARWEKVFSEDVFERLVRGETCITEVSDEYKQRLLDKNIVRLIKGRDGSVNMERATEFGIFHNLQV